MKIIVGLGNPGSQYLSTRHNAGLMLVDRLASVLDSPYGWRRKKDAMVYESDGMRLIKSAGVFMNESGRMTSPLIPLLTSGEGNLFVAHDDLDIKLGEYKVQWGKGPKEHNGILSVEQALGTKEFWRIRVGIDNRMSNQAISNAKSGEQYVLEKFTPEEKVVLEGVLDAIIKDLLK